MKHTVPKAICDYWESGAELERIGETHIGKVTKQRTEWKARDGQSR